MSPKADDLFTPPTWYLPFKSAVHIALEMLKLTNSGWKLVRTHGRQMSSGSMQKMMTSCINAEIELAMCLRCYTSQCWFVASIKSHQKFLSRHHLPPKNTNWSKLVKLCKHIHRNPKLGYFSHHEMQWKSTISIKVRKQNFVETLSRMHASCCMRPRLWGSVKPEVLAVSITNLLKYYSICH